MRDRDRSVDGLYCFTKAEGKSFTFSLAVTRALSARGMASNLSATDLRYYSLISILFFYAGREVCGWVGGGGIEGTFGGDYFSS